jgi:general secretion pathway protein G
MRSAIAQYRLDKGRAPQHLNELVAAGYMRAIPEDPLTNSPTWIEVPERVKQSADQYWPGIDDVHSASTLISSDGTRYDTW